MKKCQKSVKNAPPSKTPKCHLNGQNRHFVKSEPPGPAFFEFQGVPRDPVLRPKSTPLFLNVKNDHIFMICTFCISPFCVFLCFHSCDKSDILVEVPFSDIALCTTLRPYYVIKGERELCVVVLPSFWIEVFCFEFLFVVQDVGEIHRRGVSKILLSFSPLWTGFFSGPCFY